MGPLARPWPWFVAGPLIGLFVPALLLVGNRLFGISGSLRAACAALAPRRVEYFHYDWRRLGSWNLAFLLGVVLGGFLAARFVGIPDVALSPQTEADLAGLGIHDLHGLVPREVFGWSSLLAVRGFVSLVVGGFLVGFGTAYAGGCTSGHAISGLADLQLASLVAVAGFFAGGLLATHALLPLVLGGLR